jgi:hypothetical protein
MSDTLRYSKEIRQIFNDLNDSLKTKTNTNTINIINNTVVKISDEIYNTSDQNNKISSETSPALVVDEPLNTKLHAYKEPDPFSDLKVYKTIGDGSCLIHSFLNSTSEAYRSMNDKNKGSIGMFFRGQIISLFYLDELIELINSNFKSENFIDDKIDLNLNKLNSEILAQLQLQKPDPNQIKSKAKELFKQGFVKLFIQELNGKSDIIDEISNKYVEWFTINALYIYLEDDAIQKIADIFKINILVLVFNVSFHNQIYSIFYSGKKREEMTTEFISTMPDNEYPWIIMYNS